MENQKKLSTLNIVGIILIAIFLPIIAVNLTIVIKGWTNPEEIPMVFDTAPLIVISDSMTIDKKADTGAFNKGDLIFVKKVDPTTLKVGDVITYISNDKEGSIITHRIVSIYEEGSFETKGDYSPGYDRDPVKHDQVVGKYTGRIAGAGDLAMFFQSPAGVIVLIGSLFVNDNPFTFVSQSLLFIYASITAGFLIIGKFKLTALLFSYQIVEADSL